VSESAFPPFDEWLIDAADLLAEDDPGPTPWLVDDLIVEGALIAGVGSWKTTKTYGLMEIAISVRTGLPAFGRFAVPNPGPVVFVIEESGRAALWRRLDALCRGRGIDPERLRGLVLAANAGVKLDDPDWQKRLIDAGQLLEPRLFVFDPLARMKSSRRAENEQTDMADLIEFWRTLRDETGAAVEITHHSGHTGDHMRGTSDLETVWETRLKWERDKTSGVVTLTSEHREAEAGPPFKYRIAWDETTRTMSLAASEPAPPQRDLVADVVAFLSEHPASVVDEIASALKKRPSDIRAVFHNNARFELVPSPPDRRPDAKCWSLTEKVVPDSGTTWDGVAVANPSENPSADPYTPVGGVGAGRASRNARPENSSELEEVEQTAAGAVDLERARRFHAKHPPRTNQTNKQEEDQRP
jgi:hypothetical protein